MKAQPFVKKKETVYVAGHRGMVGSAIVRSLCRHGWQHILARSHEELDLLDQHLVRTFFGANRIDVVILAAAKVGGILANASYPADFIYDNLAIQTNVIHEAWRAGIRKLIFLGSSCIYPRMAPQPLKETCLLSGPLEPTNEPYAVAKIAGIKMCQAYNRQYQSRYLTLMPTNLYGPGDHYDLNNSHVLPALLRKMHEAKEEGRDEVVLWGSGNVRREFLHSDDFGEAVATLLGSPEESIMELFAKDQAPMLNIGCGEDIRIRDLAKLVGGVVGFQGNIVWDSSKPDGTPRKLLDVSRMYHLGWRPTISLPAGIKATYRDFLERVRNGRHGCPG